jgi:hypothetical protein
MYFYVHRVSRKPQIFAQAFIDARKEHPDMQFYFQTVTLEQNQALENDREGYKKILKSQVCVPIHTCLSYVFCYLCHLCF